MAYFDCIVGGSGKGNTVTVTCAEEFAGLTITLSKTGKTYTKTCPSTAPYTVTYYGVENGTYTVSCTVGGQTYSETVVVQDISCVLNYGFTWRTWVDTASQLDSSDYDSLDEVLADEKALRELFLEHACVDYMAEATSSNADLETIINDDYCAKWINNSDYALDFLGANTVIKALMDEADKYGYGEWVITDDTTTPATWGPKGNVPVMTSTSAPYGASSMSVSPASGYESYKIFDRNPQTRADTGGPALSGARIYYKFTNPTNVRRAYWAVQTSGGVTRNVKWQYSDDGTTWTDAKSESIVQTAGYFKHYTDIPDCGYHLYWAYYLVSSSTTTTSFGNELQFYGRELKVSVPTMTSNTAPFGEASASSVYDSTNYVAWHAFSPSQRYGWAASSSGLTNAWCRYDFTSPIVIKAFYAGMVDDAYLNNMKVQGLVNNEWVDFLTFSVSASGKKVFAIENANNIICSSFRVFGTTNTAGGGYKFNFYGKDYSEKEFEVGATKKWLYDHGVEVTALTISGTGTKNSDHIQLKASNAQASATINTTAYTLMRGKAGAHASGTNQLLCGSGSSNFTTSNMPNNNGLNVSSINGSNAVGVKQTANGVFDVTEIWLE